MKQLDSNMKQILIDQFNEIREAETRVSDGVITLELPAPDDRKGLDEFAHKVLVNALTRSDSGVDEFRQDKKAQKLVNLGNAAQMLANDLRAAG